MTSSRNNKARYSLGIKLKFPDSFGTFRVIDPGSEQFFFENKVIVGIKLMKRHNRNAAA